MRQTLFRTTALALCLISIGAYGQKQTKTFNETFTVTKDAILDIDTSHADIEFETWNKNQVAIETTIELEGVTDEEAERYFEDGGVEILGNSKKVTINTGDSKFRYATVFDQHHDFDLGSVDIPELSGLEPLILELSELPELAVLPEIAELPPVFPRIITQDFDYEKYKKEGDAYLKEWKKEFDENFDEEYQEKLEEWSDRMARKQDERKKRLEEMHKRMEERNQQRKEMHEKRAEARAERDKLRKESREKIRVVRKGLRGNALFIEDKDDGKSNTFYWSTDGKLRNHKIKKTIKIKMPKGMKIKMNVRHGEVKLAENTKNINATLSHANLWAATIDGDKTTITASYSPVSVERWNYGALQANYSENVDLKEVLNLRLSSKSSDVTIDRLVNSAYISNNFGPLKINSVSKNFKEMDISLQNAELDCELPETPFTIYVNGTSSQLSCPASITLSRTKNHNNTIHKGCNISMNTDKSITINSKYSKVVLQ